MMSFLLVRSTQDRPLLGVIGRDVFTPLVRVAIRLRENASGKGRSPDALTVAASVGG